MRSLLILNPLAGADRGPTLLPQLNESLRERFGRLEIAITVGPDDATQIARQAALEGVGRLFVGGGDGTLNEVLNGLGSVDGALGRIPIGLIPLGTGNDFAATLGLPEDPLRAARLLSDDRTAWLDVGRLNDVRFINMSAGGFIAEVSLAATEPLKTLAGRLAYLIGGAQVLFSYDPLPGRVACERVVSAEAAGAPFLATSRLQFFAVNNAPMAGGGHVIAPRALLDDGLLDVCIAEAMTTVEFIRVLRRLNAGQPPQDPRVVFFQTDELRLEFDRATPVNTDGQVRLAQTCHYRVEPRAARFLVGPAPRRLRA